MDSGSGPELNVAVAAMVVAVTAFVVACAQLLQQLFGTADGYRRCQPSVIGDWYDLVHLRWKWSEFRFETKFVTPHFVIERLQEDDVDIQSKRDRPRAGPTKYLPPKLRWQNLAGLEEPEVIAITGSDRARTWTFSAKKHRFEARRRGTPLYKDMESTEDQVSWSILLQEIHEVQSIQLMSPDEIQKWTKDIPPHINYRQHDNLPKSFTDSTRLLGRVKNTETMAIRLKQKSWDFVPADITRPLASSSVGFIVVLAHRMGMSWKTLNPGKGLMRCEGAGQSISGTEVRGLGMVLSYSCEPALRPKRSYNMLDLLRIPSRNADVLGCGILPGSKQLGTEDTSFWDIHLTSSKDSIKENFIALAKMLRGMDVQEEAVKVLRESLDKDEYRLVGFSDLFGLWSDWLPLDNSPIVTVISPFRESVVSIVGTHQAGETWRNALIEKSKMGTITQQQKEILALLQHWSEKHQDHFFNSNMLGGNKLKHVQYISDLKEIFDFTTKYFKEKNEASAKDIPNRPSRWFYAQLVAAHISTVVPAIKEAELNRDIPETRREKKMSKELYEKMQYMQSQLEKLLDARSSPPGSQESPEIQPRSQESIAAARALDSIGTQMRDTTGGGLQRRSTLISPASSRRQPRVDKTRLIAEVYVQNVEDLVDDMVGRGYIDREEIEDAYWMLLLRGLAWSRAIYPVYLEDAERIPSFYYDSTTPVYIT